MLAGSISRSNTYTPWRTLTLGRGGYTVATTLSNLSVNNDPSQFSASIITDAETQCERTSSVLERCTTALRGVYPAVILLNLGVNDLGFTAPGSLPNQTTWQNNYIAIIDALNAQWPSVPIYLMKPWKQGFDANCDTLAGWIDNVIAARPAAAFAGPDERTWLKSGDNGATRTSDGVHYSAAGHTECAAQWKTTLGY
jgi:lysophospholipase L1-like esterase